MGSEIVATAEPRFRVRALGALRQRPGCPDHAVAALGSQRLEQLCGSECYFPAEGRHPIDRIEVIRIWSSNSDSGDLSGLVEDPWRIYKCNAAQPTCEVTFSDPEFQEQASDVSYYVRAVQEPTDTINGAGLRCRFDEEGDCVAVDICYGDQRTPAGDDCVAPVAHRAWSSPIFLDFR